MGKDYVQRDSGGRQTRGGPPKAGMPGWIWLLVGVALGVAGAAGYYISRPLASAPITAIDDKSPVTGRRTVEIPPKKESRFTFYELLPKYEVLVPKETLKPAPKPAAAPANGGTAAPAATNSGARFLIQAGSFPARTDAEQQKANLALLGIESKIESVTIDNRDTWYRVRIGPERSEQKVRTILASLEENQIESQVIRVPD